MEQMQLLQAIEVGASPSLLKEKQRYQTIFILNVSNRLEVPTQDKSMYMKIRRGVEMAKDSEKMEVDSPSYLTCHNCIDNIENKSFKAQQRCNDNVDACIHQFTQGTIDTCHAHVYGLRPTLAQCYDLLCMVYVWLVLGGVHK